jgi:hypothetical protein
MGLQGDFSKWSDGDRAILEVIPEGDRADFLRVEKRLKVRERSVPVDWRNLGPLL